MFKIYSMTHYVSIDGKEWTEVGFDGGYCMCEEEKSETVKFENLSFDECYKLIQAHNFYGLRADHTLFRGCPQINVNYWPDTTWYTRFKTISYKTTYKEANYLSVLDIMKIFPAEQCIQYLKERGMTTCPMINTK